MARPGRDRRAAAAAAGLIERLFAPAVDAAEWSVEQLRSVVGGAIDAATHPQQLAEKAALVLAGAGTLAVELLKTPDPRSPLKGDFGCRSASPGPSRSPLPT